jgi:diguanylate cyclase (GGDEF)-like protein
MFPVAIRLLIIERAIDDAEQIVATLRNACLPVRPHYVGDEEALHAALLKQQWDMLIIYPQVPGLHVDKACNISAASGQDLSIIVFDDGLSETEIRQLFYGGTRQVVPMDSPVRLEIAVRLELTNLEERRKRYNAEHLWREIYRQNKILFESSRDAIAYIHEGMHIRANPAYLNLFGYQDVEELEGVPVLDLIAATHQTQFKHCFRDFMNAPLPRAEKEISLRAVKADQTVFSALLQICEAYCTQESCIQIKFIETAQEYELERKLREAWRIDPQTKLYNRLYFAELLGKALTRGLQEKQQFLIYLCVDGRDWIHDTHGLVAWDQVSLQVAQLLKPLHKIALIARFEGACFTMLVREKSLAEVKKLAERLRQHIEDLTIEGEGFSFAITCSIGIAEIHAAEPNHKKHINNAYNACQKAVIQGGNRIELYTPPIKSTDTRYFSSNNAHDVKEFIESAIEYKRLSLWYMPIVTLYQEDSVESHEVYLSMLDEDGRKVPAAELFSMATESGCTLLLDKWVIRKTIDALLEHVRSGMRTRFFVKLSKASVKSEELCDYIGKLLKARHVPPERLVFQVTEESAAVNMKETYQCVNALRALGCKMALEHFGTGLNSAILLRRMPVDYVKIDASYSHGLGENADNQKVVESMVALAHSLDKLTIAEGVEEASCLTVLFQCKVDYVQGYYVQE